MSFEPPDGILDIGNATLRVGKLEVAETSGLNQGLLNIVKNNILINENTEYSSSNTWGIKLPTTWVAEFDVKGHSTTKYVEFNFYNEDKTSNALGYVLNFKDTTMSLMYDTSLSGDQNILTTATIPTIVGTYRKVNIFFERGVISVSIDGTRYLYHKETDGYNQGLGVASRVVSATGGAFVNVFIEENATNSKFKNLRIVNGRFISDKTSNIAFIGGNLGVGVNSPKETLDIRGNMHFNRVSNVSSISVDSNVVTEYTGPHDRPLRKYPEVALLSGQSGLSGGYTQDGYTVKVSNESSPSLASYAFNGKYGDNDVTGAFWYTGNLNTYNGTPTGGYYVGSVNLGSDGGRTATVSGDWIELELPNKIKLEYFKYFSQNNSVNGAQDGVLYARNTTNEDWTLVHSYTDALVPDQNTPYTFNVNSTNYYKIYALVLTRKTPANTGTGGVAVGELEYYGYEEGSASLDTTLKSVYNVPATTGTQLEVYYDAKDLADGAVTNVTDLSPNTNGGLPSDSPQVSNGAFVFDGVNDYIYNSQSGFTGEKTYTASAWIKKTANINGCVFQFGNGSDGNSIGIFYFGGSLDYIRAYVFGYAAANSSPSSIPLNEWIHVTGVYSDKTATLYINGIEVATNTGSTGITIPSTPYLTLGAQTDNTNTPYAGTYFTGSIANFRLYSKALNAGQVQELYDYQKDYFLGSKSQVTLYKGHLGVGVTEPSGQLELAGDERIQEYPPRAMTGYEMLVEGHGVFCASASSYYNATPHLPWQAFTPAASSGVADGWNSGDNSTGTNLGYYAETASGEATSAAALFEGTRGEWVQLKCPYPIIVKKFAITGRSNGVYTGSPEDQPKSGILYGSNDGNNWNVLANFSGLTYGGASGGAGATGGTEIVEVNATKGYTRLVLQATARVTNSGTDDWINIGQLQYFGTPGPTTLDKGSLTLGRSLDVPRISRYDVDTETPRPEKLLVDFDTTVNSSPTDISGNGNNGTFYGNARYSAADKAFDIGYSSVAGQIASGPINVPAGAGVFIHSVSFWAWIDDWNQPFFYIDDTYPASGQDNNTAHAVLDSAGLLRYDFWGNAIQVVNGNAFPKKQWVHVGLVYKGGNVTSTSVEIYYDGVRQAVNTASNAAYTSPSSVRVQIGGTGARNFRISNFKLYNVALEPSEVKKLYNLGRTGRSMVISDTAVGIGKVPEAQLDVRGLIKASNMYVPGTIIQVRTNNDDSASTGNSQLSFVTSAAATGGNIPIAQATGLKAKITPRSTKSRIYADFHVLLYLPTMTNITGARLQVWRKVGSTYTKVYGANGHDLHHYDNHTGSLHTYTRATFVDNSPNTLEECEYELRAMLFTTANAGNLQLGNGGNQPANCVLMEIADE